MAGGKRRAYVNRRSRRAGPLSTASAWVRPVPQSSHLTDEAISSGTATASAVLVAEPAELGKHWWTWRGDQVVGAVSADVRAADGLADVVL